MTWAIARFVLGAVAAYLAAFMLGFSSSVGSAIWAMLFLGLGILILASFVVAGGKQLAMTDLVRAFFTIEDRTKRSSHYGSLSQVFFLLMVFGGAAYWLAAYNYPRGWGGTAPLDLAWFVDSLQALGVLAILALVSGAVALALRIRGR